MTLVDALRPAGPRSGEVDVDLRPVHDDDLAPLWRCAELAEHRWLRLWRLGPLDPGRFAAVLWHGVLGLWVARGPRGPLAVVGLHDADFRDGTAFVELVPLVEPHLSRGDLDAALHRLVELAEAEWGFRHLYARHLAVHEPTFAAFGGVAAEIGRLPRAVYADGDHVDLVYEDLDLEALHAVSGSSAPRSAPSGVEEVMTCSPSSTP